MQILGYHKKCSLLYEKQGGKCFYCDTEFKYHQMSRDHFYPKSKGYKGHWNTVLSCRKCNSEKSSLTIYEFREYMCREVSKYLKLPRVMNQLRLEDSQIRLIRRYFNIIKKCTFLLRNPDAFLEVASGPHLKNKKQ